MRSEVDFDVRAFQMKCLEIMDTFDAVCRANGLRYYMACGTMLGAEAADISLRYLVAGRAFTTQRTTDVSSLADGYMSIIAAAVLLAFSFAKENKLGKIAGITFLALLVAYYAYRICATLGVCPMIEIPTLFD